MHIQLSFVFPLHVMSIATFFVNAVLEGEDADLRMTLLPILVVLVYLYCIHYCETELPVWFWV
jgi:hypothetical protein